MNEPRVGPRNRLTCALLTTFRYDWAAEVVSACPGLDVVTIDPSVLGLASAPNPFGLRVESRTDVVVISSIWLRWLTDHHGGSVDEVLSRLERHGGLLVGLDSADDFCLDFPPDQLAPFEVILKPQGTYRDRDLYNYELGPWFPGANWTEKTTPRDSKYRDVDLEKIRLSVPCFMKDFRMIRRVSRKREEGPSASRPRRLSHPERHLRDLADLVFMKLLRNAPLSGAARNMDVHCVLSLTHIQRLDALRALEGIGGARGITRVPEYVAGITRREDWSATEQARVNKAAEPYRRTMIGRAQYFLGLARHRVAVAPTGYGELTFRHAEALLAGAALVCQDASHVDMMYPFVNGWNAILCRPDLSDLQDKVKELLNNDDERQRIARNGRHSMVDWSRHWRKQLFEGIERHIEQAVTK